MAKQNINFYETLKEAHIRLRNTVVLYDKEPYFVIAITNHHKDGIFRIYLAPIDRSPDKEPVPWPDVNVYPPEHSALGGFLDKWLDDNPKAGILRKQMNSPLFDKYRPFPLGMCNYGTKALYLERSPARPKTEQGLTRQMIQETTVSLRNDPEELRGKGQVDIMSLQLRRCIVAEHPAPQLCLDNLLSDEFRNEAVAFHREFAFVKGPIGMVFLAYKTDVIGVLPKNNFEYLRLGKAFRQCREACLDLGLFANID